MSHPEPLVIVVFALAGLLVALQLWLHWPRRRRPQRPFGTDLTAPLVGNHATRQRHIASRPIPPPASADERPYPPHEGPLEKERGRYEH